MEKKKKDNARQHLRKIFQIPNGIEKVNKDSCSYNKTNGRHAKKWSSSKLKEEEILFHTMSNGFVELLAQGVTEAKNMTGFRKGIETFTMKNSFSVYWIQRLSKLLFATSWEESMPTGGLLYHALLWTPSTNRLQVRDRVLGYLDSWLTLCQNFYVDALQWGSRSLWSPFHLIFSN